MAFSTGYTAGLESWQNGPVTPEWTRLQQQYTERWFRYSGQLFEVLAYCDPESLLYLNTKLIWKHVESIVDFYAGVIYQGALSTDGKPFSDNTPLAIPIDPRTGSEESDNQLLLTIAQLWMEWNWQEQMTTRPMYGAALGDGLTELVDSRSKRMIYPKTVWPGYVKDIELDYASNVVYYVLEYRVHEKDRQGNSMANYKYRKEVDDTSFRYFKDDRLSSVVENPYGFVPAIWDRHKPGAPGSVRGRSATDGTRQALNQLNSLFSHTIDFQHKAFSVPAMVASNNWRGSGTPEVNLEAPPNVSGVNIAELWRYRKVPGDAQILQASFDTGTTLQQIKDIREGILSENPEASFYARLREMQMVTAPGAEMLMGDVTNLVSLARARYDTQTVKLFQMALAMCGFRANDLSADGWRANGPMDPRRQSFLPYNLDSYEAGSLDMAISPRPIVNPSVTERLDIETKRVQLVAAQESLTTPWAVMQSLKMTEEEANAFLDEKQERYLGQIDRSAFGDDQLNKKDTPWQP